MGKKEKIRKLIDIWEPGIKNKSEEERIKWETELLNELKDIKDKNVDFWMIS